MKPLWITGKVGGADVGAGMDAEGDAMGSPVVLNFVRRAVQQDRYVQPPFPWPSVKASLTDPLGFTCAMLELCDANSVQIVSGREELGFEVGDAIV